MSNEVNKFINSKINNEFLIYEGDISSLDKYKYNKSNEENILDNILKDFTNNTSSNNILGKFTKNFSSDKIFNKIEEVKYFMRNLIYLFKCYFKLNEIQNLSNYSSIPLINKQNFTKIITLLEKDSQCLYKDKFEINQKNLLLFFYDNYNKIVYFEYIYKELELLYNEINGSNNANTISIILNRIDASRLKIEEYFKEFVVTNAPNSSLISVSANKVFQTVNIAGVITIVSIDRNILTDDDKTAIKKFNDIYNEFIAESNIKNNPEQNNRIETIKKIFDELSIIDAKTPSNDDDNIIINEFKHKFSIFKAIVTMDLLKSLTNISTTSHYENIIKPILDIIPILSNFDINQKEKRRKTYLLLYINNINTITDTKYNSLKNKIINTITSIKDQLYITDENMQDISNFITKEITKYINNQPKP
jgi:hypothetical protein